MTSKFRNTEECKTCDVSLSVFYDRIDGAGVSISYIFNARKCYLSNAVEKCRMVGYAQVC